MPDLSSALDNLSIGEPGQAFRQIQATLPFLTDTPDSVCDGGQVGQLAVRAASVRGLVYRYKALPRQDCYGAAVSDDGKWLVAVVADGVSKGHMSHRAARLVATRGPRLVLERMAESAPTEIDWYAVFRQLGQMIIDLGTKLIPAGPQEVPGAMATTATFVVCSTELVDGVRPVVVAWQGDSPAWRLSAMGDWRCLSEIKNADADEIASSVVSALPYIPRSRDDQLMRAYVLAPDDAVFVMSDGVGDPLGHADDEVAATLADYWREPPNQHLFAAQIGFGRKGFDDDRTVVGIWGRGA